jgi:hypothetical protein
MWISPRSTKDASASPSRGQRPTPARADASEHGDADLARLQLDRLLQLVERRPLSILELRLLLRLNDGEATIPQLSDELGHDVSDVVSAASRLTNRGFVRRRSIGRHRRGMFSIARPGLVTVRPLLTAVAHQLREQ